MQMGSHMKNARTIGCILILLSFLLTGSANCPSAEPADFRIGYPASAFPGVDTRDAKVAMKVLLSRLVDNFNQENGWSYSATGMIYNDLESMLEAVRSGEINAIWLSSVDYLNLCQPYSLEPFLIASAYDEPTSRYVLLARSDVTLETLKPDRKTTLLLQTGAMGKIAQLWLDTLLLRNGFAESGEFFSTTNRVERASRAVLPVFFGQADACVVSRKAFETVVEMNPQLKTQLNVLAESPPLINPVSCFCGSVKEEDRRDLKKALSMLKDKPDGEQMLMLFRMNAIFEFHPEYLRSLEELCREYHQRRSPQESSS